MPKIIIDNKEIEISQESYEELKKSLLEKEFKFKYPAGKIFFIDVTDNFIRFHFNGGDSTYINSGLYRKSEKNARKSLERIKRTNRLEALVEQIQGNFDGEYFIYKKIKTGLWAYTQSCQTDYYPEVILMKESTAKKIVKMLNNGEFSLDA